jgi:integrase
LARAGSINYQVGIIIKAHNGLGTSKLESRNKSEMVSLESKHKVSDKFHSYKSLENARNDLKNLGNYAKSEHKIKDMSKIDINIVKDWIYSKDITYNTASNYLSELNKVAEHLNIKQEEVKELRAELKTELRTNELKSRAYKKLDTIKLVDKSQVAFELQRDYGLRVAPATHINIEKQIQGNTFIYREKGGQMSERELSNEMIQKIKDNAIDGKYELSYNTYRDQLQKAIKESGQKYNGTHGIRHSYAQKQLETKSKAEVAKELGHVREEITNIYIR